MTAVTVSEALQMSPAQFEAADRIIFFTSLRDSESALEQLWESCLKPVRYKSIMLLAISEETPTEQVVALTGVDFGNGIYLKSMAPIGRVFFMNMDEFHNVNVVEALESLYDHATLHLAGSGETPQFSTKHFQLKKLYTGYKNASLYPSYSTQTGDFSFSSKDEDKIAIMLDVAVNIYSYPGSTDRYAVVEVKGAGIQPRLDMNNGDVLSSWYHSGTSYIKNLAQHYFVLVEAEQTLGSPVIYSFLPANALSSTTVTNTQNLSLEFSKGAARSKGFNYSSNQTVTYTQTDFETIASQWTGSGNQATMEWRVRAQNIYNRRVAWIYREKNHLQTPFLDTGDITYTEIPVIPKSAFIVTQSSLPQLYSIFAPQMTATIYTTSSQLSIRVMGGVTCQHTSTNYSLGARGLGNGINFTTQTFSDETKISINFGDNIVCLMDR